MTIHKNYNLLNQHEREFIDDVFHSIFQDTKKLNIKLTNNDLCEIAVEAMATWFMKSKE